MRELKQQQIKTKKCRKNYYNDLNVFGTNGIRPGCSFKHGQSFILSIHEESFLFDSSLYFILYRAVNFKLVYTYFVCVPFLKRIVESLRENRLNSPSFRSQRKWYDLLSSTKLKWISIHFGYILKTYRYFTNSTNEHCTIVYLQSLTALERTL